MLPNDALWISIAWHNSQWVYINSEGAFLFFLVPEISRDFTRFHEIKLRIIINIIDNVSWTSRKTEHTGIIFNPLWHAIGLPCTVRATFIFTNANVKRPKQAVQLCTKVIDDHQFSLQLHKCFYRLLIALKKTKLSTLNLDKETNWIAIFSWMSLFLKEYSFLYLLK